jgi:hypothetical protein
MESNQLGNLILNANQHLHVKAMCITKMEASAFKRFPGLSSKFGMSRIPVLSPFVPPFQFR